MKKAPLASKKNLPNGSGSEDESDSAPTPAKRKPSDDDDVDMAPAKPANKKSASEMYQKVSDQRITRA